VTAGNLPTGLSLASGGVLSGTPTTAGTYTYTVKATGSSGASATRQDTIQIAGTPGASVSPGSVSFGSQEIGTTSSAQTVTLTSSGSAPLNVSGVSVGGTNAGDYAISNDGCSGKSLAPGQNCTVQVTFTPSATGARSATLSFADNAAGSPQTVALSGTGSRQADLAISLSATPNPVKVKGTLTYTVRVVDNGPDQADGVTVTDVIPSGSQFASITPNGWSCTTPPAGQTGTVTCKRASLASGASSSFQLAVTVVQSAKSTVSNTATVSSQATDPNPANNTATATTSVQGRA
jgi:uncharacterized repeat protein (TIGR01451 family)